ncbi:MAG TPA: type II secretion system F family protein [Pirellulaceae bacterium]|nr:type II secretion system F family protein [Pirellulaceae bacterium]
MDPFILVVIAAAVATTMAMLAIGLFIRDLCTKPIDPSAKQRLEMVPEEEVHGSLDQWFVRLIEESGLPLTTSAALLIVVASGLIAGAIPLVFFENFLGAALCLIAGSSIPLVVFCIVRWRRISQMRKHMPETLQIVADAVRGGHTLEEACQFVSREMTGPLREEFAQAYSQFSLGHSPVSIMNRLARRIPLAEFRIFATAVMVHRRAGGNLAVLTERLSHTARDRQEVRGHLMAVSAGSRLSAIGMVVGSMLALAVLAWLEPEYLSIFFTHRLGPTLLAIAAALQIVGVIWVWRVLKVNY